jgi:plastocyanin
MSARLLAAALIALGTFAACFSDRPGPAGPLPDVSCLVPLPAFGPGRAVVLIHDFQFIPDTLRVTPGTTVTWVSCEPPLREAHTVEDVAGAWGSPLLAAGAAFERRFDEAGSAHYLCGPHPHMRGVILVE